MPLRFKAVTKQEISSFQEGDENMSEFEKILKRVTLIDALRRIPTYDQGGKILERVAQNSGYGGPLALDLPLATVLERYIPVNQQSIVVDTLYRYLMFDGDVA